MYFGCSGIPKRLTHKGTRDNIHGNYLKTCIATPYLSGCFASEVAGRTSTLVILHNCRWKSHSSLCRCLFPLPRPREGRKRRLLFWEALAWWLEKGHSPPLWEVCRMFWRARVRFLSWQENPSLFSALRRPRPSCCTKIIGDSVGRSIKIWFTCGMSIPSLKMSTVKM